MHDVLQVDEAVQIVTKTTSNQLHKLHNLAELF